MPTKQSFFKAIPLETTNLYPAGFLRMVCRWDSMFLKIVDRLPTVFAISQRRHTIEAYKKFVQVAFVGKPKLLGNLIDTHAAVHQAVFNQSDLVQQYILV